MKKVILCSGGIDSSTCLAIALENTEKEDILALNCFYGQKNKREMMAARNIADHYGVRIIEMDISENFKFSDCPMLIDSGKDIDMKSYDEQIEDTKGLQPISSYVPFRNGVMLSIATAIAYSFGASEVWYGAHADDAEGNAYPDCSEAFISAMNSAIQEGTARKVSIVAPLKNMRKKDVIKKGLQLHVPYELTWSCYESGDHPCGKCGTCIAIKEAFHANGVEYPVK